MTVGDRWLWRWCCGVAVAGLVLGRGGIGGGVAAHADRACWRSRSLKLALSIHTDCPQPFFPTPHNVHVGIVHGWRMLDWHRHVESHNSMLLLCSSGGAEPGPHLCRLVAGAEPGSPLTSPLPFGSRSRARLAPSCEILCCHCAVRITRLVNCEVLCCHCAHCASAGAEQSQARPS